MWRTVWLYHLNWLKYIIFSISVCYGNTSHTLLTSSIGRKLILMKMRHLKRSLSKF
ncbi:hypothetical protein ACSBR1_016547 [Camellia fascicularis]